jgi:phytoene dehydrogenase-like protein
MPEIDLERLKEKISKTFCQSGGRMEEVDGIEKIDRGWRRGFALMRKGEQGVVTSKCLILNSPLRSLSSILGKRKKWGSQWEEKIQPRYLLVPFFLGIHEKVVPVGMRDLLVSIFDLDRPYEEGNVLFIALSQKGDESDAPEGRRALTVESLVPIEKWKKSSMDEHQEKVLDHLRYLFPFLNEHMEFMEGGWADEQSSCWSYPHFIYETPSDFNWREGIVPHRLSRNLYFVGKENFPYLGLEAEVMSGLIVAKQILGKFS